jgi:hypothetical protein
MKNAMLFTAFSSYIHKNNRIGRVVLFISFLLYLQSVRAQNGLENIIVEKYYISDASDTLASAISGALPIGSVTYRIYLDMLPGYRFQAAYGTASHELRLETTTSFYNNEHIGNNLPNVIPRRTLKRNTVMLDSWLSAGGAGEDMYGVLKEQDDASATVVHEGPYLQNSNKLAGIPVKERDGLLAADDVPSPVFFGIDSILPVFNNMTRGSLFSTRNGAWACLGGAVGPDSLTTNRVLIAQLTTNGDLTFELNIQIGKRDSPPENYVARNPVEKEILLPSLTYCSKPPKLSASKNTKTVNKKK